MDKPGKFGLAAALATPFNADSSVNLEQFAAHARRCLDRGCQRITAMGTTGENASLGLGTRQQMLNCLVDSGITGEQLVVGICASDQSSAEAQIQQAIDVNASHVLLPPPFYFKGVSQQGIQNWYAGVLQSIGSSMPPTILYHIPSQTAAAVGVELVSSLRDRFGAVIAGVKDSGGEWGYTSALLSAHKDIAILIGDERHLGRGMREGAEGAICGVANLYPENMRAIIDSAQDDTFIIQLVDLFVAYPIIPALKALMADTFGEMGWQTVRAPLTTLDPADVATLLESHSRLRETQRSDSEAKQ